MDKEERKPIIQNVPVVPPVTLTVSTAAGMRSLGRRLAALLRAGDLVILAGGLGSGKTTLTKGIGDGLGVRGPITSPTFVIARVHPPVAGSGGDPGTESAGPRSPRPRPPLVHVDAYRIGSALELDDLDLDTDAASSVTVVEWGEGLAEGLAVDRLEIAIEAARDAHGAEDEYEGDVPRTVRISTVGDRWEGIELPLADLAHRL